MHSKEELYNKYTRYFLIFLWERIIIGLIFQISRPRFLSRQYVATAIHMEAMDKEAIYIFLDTS